MSIIKSNSIALKIAIGLIGIAFAFALLFGSASSANAAALTQSQIDAIIALLESFGADQSVVDNVNASLTGSTPTTTTSTASVCPHTWATDLTSGSAGADVKALQQFLNSDSATQVASSGVGSAGSETDFFGSLTTGAVIKFQDKYAADVLTPVGLSAGTGYFGPSSRAKANSLCSTAAPTTTTTTTDDTTTTTTTTTTGTGLSVAAGVQPTATLAPDSAARVPFTNFIVTAGSDGDVVMDNVTVERIGLASDSVFASVVLLDEDGTQVGLTKTLNSNHQATVGEARTIPAGTSKQFTIGGNMAADNSSRDGETPAISVVAINTSATVTGSLPITGTTQTVNASLAIGTITAARGPLDPNAAASKEVGTTGYTFTSLKITAGSAEEVRLHSLRWNQASSVAEADLDNLVTVVDGTEYPATITADGKYYTSTFNGGLVIDKGLSVEISVKGDIIGGSGRTAAFSIEKKTDLNLSGETFGYGITPPTSGTGITSGNIWFAGSTVTVSGGSLTVTQDTGVASQNIAINLADQTLAAIKVKAQGEAVTAGSIVFDVATSTGAWTGLLTNVTLVDGNGAVVAGPVDTSGTGATITFSDSVTFPVGEGTYIVKGKTPSTAGNDGTYQLTTNPASDWTTVTGDNTGNTITPAPSGDAALQTMTISGAAVTLSTSNSPAAQNVVKGAQNYTFANIQFDTTSSGEDVKFTSFPINISMDGTASDLTSCQLWNGDTALNTGGNAVAVSSVSSSTTFTFDEPLILAKGVVTTLPVTCNLSSSATATEIIYVSYAPASSPTATGLTSGQSATITEPTAANSLGQRQTVVASGTITVAIDAASPSYKIAAGGSTGNIVNVLKFTGTNEAINLQDVALQLTNGTASSTAAGITKVTLWDGSREVGTAIFTTGNTIATSTLLETVTIPKNGDIILTVKADFTDIGTGQSGTDGHLHAIDWDNDASIGTSGIGQESGSTIERTSGSDTESAGVRVFNSFPTIAKLEVPTNTLSNGSKTLLRWSVTADSAGDIAISKFTLTIATTTAIVRGVDIFGYTDSGYTSVVTGLSTDGGFLGTDKVTTSDHVWASGSSQIDIDAQNSSSASTTITIPAGGTRYFEARGTVSSSASGASVSTQLEGDATFDISGLAVTTAFMAGAAIINGDSGGTTHNDFIWSTLSTTTADVANESWTNGYGVSGLPGTYMAAEVLSQ